MYKITVVRSRNLVEARLTGVFTPAMIDAYEAELLSHFIEGRLRPGYFMLIDVSDAEIQPRETIAAPAVASSEPS